LRSLIHDDVVWREPKVGDHMGELHGVDAVIDMMERARHTTGGSFALHVEKTIATRNSCAAVIRWQAHKGGHDLEGRELAVFSFQAGLITEAAFFPENIDNDHDFWA